MNEYIYDCEVFKHEYLVGFKNIETGEYTQIWNDNEKIAQKFDGIFYGFNSKGYDKGIVKGIAGNHSPEEIKKLNDDIIVRHIPYWENETLKGNSFFYNDVDLMLDMQNGLSLKAIEGHLGMNIQESEVDFNIDRPLTPEERKETEEYNRHDLDATEVLLKVRSGYISTKENLGKRIGLPKAAAIGLTNAQLTAKLLGAVRVDRDDGREYDIPENLPVEELPEGLLEFYLRIRDTTIPDNELFASSFERELGGMLVKWAWGGVHGSKLQYHEKRKSGKVIKNADVSSLYPSLLDLYDYISRNITDKTLFSNIKKERIQAKHDGNKQLAKDLKLPLNTVSGAQENQYNDLYDPKNTRSMRITGQLFITVLAMRLLKACKTIELLNLNTDGLMWSIDEEEEPIAEAICKDWEKMTRLELEFDDIEEVFIKDVNNLCVIKTDGEVKTVGGYLNYGVSEKGAWSINNNYIAVKKALVEYFVKGTPVRETIENNTAPFDFQIIAKVSSKYGDALQEINGEMVKVQKCNRVYASKDFSLGTIYKTNLTTKNLEKVAGLPSNCLIDNANEIDLNDIDKEWYINLAERQICDFLGDRPLKRNTRAVNKIKKQLMAMFDDNQLPIR